MVKLKLVGADRFSSPVINGDVVLKNQSFEVDDVVADRLLQLTWRDKAQNTLPIMVVDDGSSKSKRATTHTRRAKERDLNTFVAEESGRKVSKPAAIEATPPKRGRGRPRKVQ